MQDLLIKVMHSRKRCRVTSRWQTYQRRLCYDGINDRSPLADKLTRQWSKLCLYLSSSALLLIIATPSRDKFC